MKGPRVQQPTSVDFVSFQPKKIRRGEDTVSSSESKESKDVHSPRSSISQRTQENERPHDHETQHSKHDHALPPHLRLELRSQPRRPSSDRDGVVDGFREDEVEN